MTFPIDPVDWTTFPPTSKGDTMTDERIKGPWRVDTTQPHGLNWRIINTETRRTVKIGPVGSKRTNFYDRAVQEANRRFFHILDLKLVSLVGREDIELQLWRGESFGSGLVFGHQSEDWSPVRRERARWVDEFWAEQTERRLKRLGYVVQPIEML